MKKILFINPSLRLHSKTKFLPVGIASVMSFLEAEGMEFDLLDIDINDMENNAVEDFLENRRYKTYQWFNTWFRLICYTILCGNS